LNFPENIYEFENIFQNSYSVI